MNILFALPGLHKVRRGAEVVFESVAQEIASGGEHQVTMLGSGQPIAERAYAFEHLPAASRDRFETWPKLPFLRSEFMYEELTFALGLLRHPARRAADVTMTCGYPYGNWTLRAPTGRGHRPAHVFVTQNGDWPAFERGGEARFFGCDGLVCTNPVYHARNRDRWRTALIPNGVDPRRFHPDPGDRARFGLPTDRPVVLMASALQANKRVLEAIAAVALVPRAHLMIAGDGPLRDEVDRLAGERLPGRFSRGTFGPDDMPLLYRSADVFLHPSIEEPFGNVYIEALSSGLPVVANDEEITRWILGEYGVFTDARSDEALARALEDAQSMTSSTRAEASAWAHATYAWSVVAGRYLEFLVETVERRRRVPA